MQGIQNSERTDSVEKDEQLRKSWARSRSFGVDPLNVEDDVLTSSELRERKDRLATLFTACASVLDNLYARLRHSLFMVLVSDPDGYIVFSKGEPPFARRARKVWLHSGANWGERVKGTNAIGTALFEQKPISVVGSEHFSLDNRFLSCYAAPLYGATGQLLGVLDVSGDARLHHPHTFGMVVAAAEACQTRILLHDVERELTLHIRESQVIDNQHDGALISVDQDGLVTRLNRRAARLLGEPEEKCIGRPLSDWFHPRHVANILSINKNGTVQAQLKADTNIWTVKSIQDERQHVYRSVLTLPSTEIDTREQEIAMNNRTVWDCRKAGNVLHLARSIARTNASVFIRGETGTGKEVIAREIHRASGRTGPLVTVNCGAIPESLIASELFGYEKGAFTGANPQGHRGKFAAADKGTLFLDEIGEMPFSSQVALLRVLEEKRFTPVGSHRTQSVNVRIIAATNRDLVRDINEKRFRADLYYRLCEIELTLPPLREREDLFALSAHFLQQIAHELNVDTFTLDESVKTRMAAYDWPGNIRELRHTLRQAAYQAYFQWNSTTIQSHHIRFLTERTDRAAPYHNEEDMLEREIVRTGGNLSQVAKNMQIGRTTLYRKLDDYPRLKKVRDEVKQKHV